MGTKKGIKLGASMSNVWDRYDVAMAKDMLAGTEVVVNDMIEDLTSKGWLNPKALTNQVMGLQSIMLYLVNNIGEDLVLPENIFLKGVVRAEPDEMLKVTVRRRKNIFQVLVMEKLADFITELEPKRKFEKPTAVESEFDELISNKLREEASEILTWMVNNLQMQSYLDVGSTSNHSKELKAIMTYIVDNIAVKGSKIVFPENMYCKNVVEAVNGYIEVPVSRKKSKYLEMVMNQIKKRIE